MYFSLIFAREQLTNGYYPSALSYIHYETINY